jgi:hypothetical protein
MREAGFVASLSFFFVKGKRMGEDDLRGGERSKRTGF